MPQLTEKLTKSQVIARGKRLKEGETLYIALIPCKANPQSVWVSPYGVELTAEHFVTRPDGLTEFQSLVNSFEYYNCNNELGTYASYYLAKPF